MKIPPRLLWSPSDVEPVEETGLKYNPHHDRQGRFAAGSGGGKGSLDDRIAKANSQYDLLSVQNEVPVGKATFLSDDGRFVVEGPEGHGLIHLDIAQLLGHKSVDDAVTDGNLTRIFVTDADRLLPMGVAIQARDLERVKFSARRVDHGLPKDRRDTTYYHWEANSKLHGYAHGEGYLKDVLSATGDVKSAKKFNWDSVTRKYNPNHSPANGRFTSRAGGSGINVAGSDEEFAFLKNAEYKRVIDPTTGAEIDVDEGLVLLMENRGFYGKPTTLEHGAFEKTDKLSLDMQYGSEKSPTSVFYRGIQDDGWGVGVEAMTKGLTEGTSRFHGVGSYGNGLYFAAEQRLATRYAVGFQASEKGVGGMVQRVAIKPDAKFISESALTQEAFDLHRTMGVSFNNVKERGRLATWLGYDGIKATDRIVVLNHSKLIIDKSSLVRISPEKKSLDLFDIELKFNPNHDRRGRFAASSRAVLSERARKHNPYHDERGRFASARGYFSGGPVNNPAPLTKAETGRIGEEIAMKYLGDTASTLNVGRNNYPIDFVSHDRVVEVKTGLSTNPKASQQWRATIGQPGKKESEWLKTATAEEKRAWNNQKRQAILERKQRAVDEVSKKLGRPLKPTTLGVIIDPHTREAHVYEFEGFHLRIGWSDKGVKEAYRASYKL